MGFVILKMVALCIFKEKECRMHKKTDIFVRIYSIKLRTNLRQK
jgi:hypothetical protein